MRNTDFSKPPGFLRRLGIQSFDAIEPVILAALATGDLLLLIGHAGTGKTLLLNSLARALGLVHRHYNAALVSFDDLVGYPYPSADGASVSFLHTPATIRQAESVLIDEISRTKPEVQNKFFTLMHERNLQGIALTALRYRWAAMNPFGAGKGRRGDSYDGSQPLDPALADRFGFIVIVPDWNQLSAEDQHAFITAPVEEPTPEAAETLVTACYAPGIQEPISLDIQSDLPRPQDAEEYFSFRNILNDMELTKLGYSPGPEASDFYQTGVWGPYGAT
jgi:MoxR-like ATPase